jgi:hypothetical protein
MLILFDNGTPRSLASFLMNHQVTEARERGWDKLDNGELLDAAEAAGFQVLLTTDRNVRCGGKRRNPWQFHRGGNTEPVSPPPNS